MLGEMNIEVTVTGNRGWVNEPEKDVYANLGVCGRVWFSAARDLFYSRYLKGIRLPRLPLFEGKFYYYPDK